MRSVSDVQSLHVAQILQDECFVQMWHVAVLGELSHTCSHLRCVEPARHTSHTRVQLERDSRVALPHLRFTLPDADACSVDVLSRTSVMLTVVLPIGYGADFVCRTLQ